VASKKQLLADYEVAANSFPEFFLRYCYLLDRVGGQGVIKMEPWQHLVDLARAFQTGRSFVILKGRQIGITWICCAYGLWRAMFTPGANVLLLSKREDEAKELLENVKIIESNLPKHLRMRIGKENESEIRFAETLSTVKVLPSTADAGRSETAALVIMDEWAFHPYAEANYAGFRPAAEHGGQIIGVSTANGTGNFFHRTYLAGKDGQGVLEARFLPYYVRPGRDDAWYDREKEEYSSKGMLRLFHQEYPKDDSEAFVASGSCFFDLDAIADCVERFVEPPSRREDNGGLLIWREPEVGSTYVIGADVAEGIKRGTSDFSHAAVYDWRRRTQVAALHGKWPPDAFANRLFQLGQAYGVAFMGVERNGPGVAVLLALRQLAYPNLYWDKHPEDLSQGRQYAPVLGWNTNRATKPILEADLSSAISSRSLVARDENFWQECRTYVELGFGKRGAQAGCKDDRVIAHGIANQMFRHARRHGSRGIRTGRLVFRS